ncbi:hypothetical protein RHOFW510R12_05480 [Rhodanobacter sp. FW510-R12]|uniref:hypothetical protein n=1 Tax=unclassified Rhodanobacter TaxID=2621553 RepID=UPI0007A9E40F|nr:MULTISPECIES: hypothetical protein [unclassified Rhodanobacter]KZC16837.1 hypothetical protein RHOFW104R8_14740 [Rhodanobacter sp. FW104-R8]KZC27648.1 hypothetical protein RhoFW510T8_14045 [Rhodanobacter sp. FW510-T8]KZC33486.1 hypothetical protein RhoFW510R10_07765 [Rhodanobacter sp. FW510-R10]
MDVKPPPWSAQANNVDWTDPSLQSLLSKTEGWSLDNRGVFTPVACELHVGWGAGVGRLASLVFERNGVMVVEAAFIIPSGEQVRIDRVQAGMLRSAWGIVMDGRDGHRAEDRAHGMRVYWVHMR